MGMSTHLAGFHPADDKYKKMLAVWNACVAAGIEVPEEVRLFFDDRDPRSSPDGVRVEMRGFTGVSKHVAPGEDGIEVDLRMIPPHIKIIRFYNKY